MDAIVIRDVTKRFKKNTIRREFTTFKSELVAWLRGRRKEETSGFIEALRGIDLVVPKGRTIGIVGRNGSGKSTLLKILTGIYQPTTGSVAVKGRISALLDLGAGFHPDFSGRENIMVNGIILGMSRNDVKARMQEIIDFSELGDFIDEPVRTYSSGMYMRLAFAVATHVDPDVLMIDEILAVGDAHFSRKSSAKMDEFKKSERTIVLVTHDLGTVAKWCDMAAWIDGGRIRAVGDPNDVVGQYQRAVVLAEAQGAQFLPPAISAGGGALPAGPAVKVPDNAIPSVRIDRLRLLGRSGHEVTSADVEEPLEVCIDFTADDTARGIGFNVSFLREDGNRVYATSTHVEQLLLPSPLPHRGTLRFTVERLGLVAGTHMVEVVAKPRDGQVLDKVTQALTVQAAGLKEGGFVRPPHRWRLETTPAEIESIASVVAS
jgi:lipopolysaccharide transport system ATP-binding protein